VPELDDGADDPLLRPEPEELEFDEPEEPVLVEPEPVLVEPELLVPDDEPVEPEDPEDVEVCEDDVPLVCEPGSIRVTTPAVATLARLTATVVLLIRLRPRARAAIARRTCSRFGVFMTRSLPSASGELLCTSSQPPMSLDADVLRWGRWAVTCTTRNAVAKLRSRATSWSVCIRAQMGDGIGRRLVTRVTA
jgi:hypothetical protein